MSTELHKLFQLMPRVLRHSRDWHAKQQNRHPMHPAIDKAFEQVNPADAPQLCLEWPYISDTDRTRLAYTANDAAGEADRQTITTLGKYLKRHFPKLADHVIRDLVARYATASSFEVSAQLRDIVNAAQNGPPSCMQWGEDRVSRLGAHPYEVYDPRYGWAVAVRKNGRQIDGRALVMQFDQDDKYYVRTYKRPDDPATRYSNPDEELAQWLQANGYRRKSGWHGEQIAHIAPDNGDCEFIAPYIDGNAQTVDLGRAGRLTITDGGEYDCTNQDGQYTEPNRCTCEDCNARMHEDDSTCVGDREDRIVCNGCMDNYTYVYGRRGHQYHIPDGDAVCVDDEYYDPEYLSDNDIVGLVDGGYCHTDNAVYVESREQYYLSEDCVCLHDGDYALTDDAVELHNGDWALSDDAWECAESGEWYLTQDDEPVIVDGQTYHEDNVPETGEEIEVTKEESC